MEFESAELRRQHGVSVGLLGGHRREPALEQCGEDQDRRPTGHDLLPGPRRLPSNVLVTGTEGAGERCSARATCDAGWHTRRGTWSGAAGLSYTTAAARIAQHCGRKAYQVERKRALAASACTP